MSVTSAREASFLTLVLLYACLRLPGQMLGQRTPATYDQRNRPAGYVGGTGRGAVGFTTRSDIGPARPGIGADSGRPLGAAPSGYVAGAGRGATGMGDSGSVGLMGSVPGAGISGNQCITAAWRSTCVAPGISSRRDDLVAPVTARRMAACSTQLVLCMCTSFACPCACVCASRVLWLAVGRLTGELGREQPGSCSVGCPVSLAKPFGRDVALARPPFCIHRFSRTAVIACANASSCPCASLPLLTCSLNSLPCFAA